MLHSIIAQLKMKVGDTKSLARTEADKNGMFRESGEKNSIYTSGHIKNRCDFVPEPLKVSGADERLQSVKHEV